jgi:hypothetical protein
VTARQRRDGGGVAARRGLRPDNRGEDNRDIDKNRGAEIAVWLIVAFLLSPYSVSPNGLRVEREEGIRRKMGEGKIAERQATGGDCKLQNENLKLRICN